METYFEEALKQKGIENIEFSIIHNAPSEAEKNIIKKYQSKLNIIYQEVSLEPLYVSWNRAILQSNGQYLACWNVDDLRTYNSIEKMLLTLDQNPDIGFTYGDIIIVNKFQNREGRYINTPEFTKSKGSLDAIGGPFFMWRKSLIDEIGYFDEQFQSGGDYDYTVRLSIQSQGKKTEGLIGYFLHEGEGLSTRSDGIQLLERTVVELRYGIWYKMDIASIAKALFYNIKHITEHGKSRPLDDTLMQLSQERRYYILFIIYGLIKNESIKTLQKIKRKLLS